MILTSYAALRPVLWTSLDTTTILLHKSGKRNNKLWFTKPNAVMKIKGGSVLEETEPCGKEVGGEMTHWLSGCKSKVHLETFDSGERRREGKDGRF